MFSYIAYFEVKVCSIIILLTIGYHDYECFSPCLCSNILLASKQRFAYNNIIDEGMTIMNVSHYACVQIHCLLRSKGLQIIILLTTDMTIMNNSHYACVQVYCLLRSKCLQYNIIDDDMTIMNVSQHACVQIHYSF